VCVCEGWSGCQATLRVFFLGLGGMLDWFLVLGRKKKCFLLRNTPPPITFEVIGVQVLVTPNRRRGLLTGDLGGRCFEGSLVFGRLKRRG